MSEAAGGDTGWWVTLSERSVDRLRHRFAGALQSALTREEVARAYIASVSEVIPAEGLGMYELDPSEGAVVDVRANVCGELLEDYESYGRQDDPVLRFVTEHQRPIDSSRVTAPDAWQECGARCALDVGGFGHSMEAPVMVTGLLFGTINFARSADAPAFSSTDLVSARIVSEQLGLATERALRFEMTGRRSSALEQALDRIPQAVVVTDLDARPIFQNRAARNDLDISSGADSVVRPTDAVGSVINEAMTQFRAEGSRVFTRSLRDVATNRQSIVKSYRLSDKEETAVTLVFNCAQSDSARTLPVWDVLTRREQEIAQLVSEGLTTKQIAAQAFISENTVKQHLKRVFAKTDVSNRAELVQLIWTSGQKPG